MTSLKQRAPYSSAWSSCQPFSGAYCPTRRLNALKPLKIMKTPEARQTRTPQ